MPDIEGVPYETTGTPLDQATANALAARHREAATAGTNAGAAAQAAAKTYTDNAVSSAVAPLATKVEVTNATAPLATKAELSAATANLVTEAALAEALADFDSFAGVPIFETLAEAQAWEAANPGKKALTLEQSTPDTTAPVAGTLTVDTGMNSATLSVSGASDDRAVSEYAFKVGTGAWSAWQAGSSYTATGLSAATTYSFQHRVRDRAGNEAVGASVSKATTAVEASESAFKDLLLSYSPQHLYPLTEAAGATSAVNLGTAGGSAAMNGTVVFGGPAMSVAPRSANFTGNANYLRLPSNVIEGAAAATVMTLVRIPDLSNAGPSAAVMGKNESWNLGVTPSGVVRAVAASMTAAQLGEPGPIKNGGVHLIGSTFDAGAWKTYVDGKVVHSGPAGSNTTIPDKNPAWINALGIYFGGTSMGQSMAYAFMLKGTALSDSQMLAAAQAAGLA